MAEAVSATAHPRYHLHVSYHSYVLRHDSISDSAFLVQILSIHRQPGAVGG